MMDYKYVFTITAGRTGTAWLSQFLGTNLGIPSVHEPLGIDDFGVRMPDIRLMRTFNERGNTLRVKRFYRRKLDEIAQRPAYAESNHTLAKCGLIENLAQHAIAPDTCVIVLRRDFVKQCVSYVNRGDFRNITVDWQWYLHHRYPNAIVSFKHFEAYGLVGRALWYVYELDARQRYYETVYGDQIKMVPARLEDITTQAGAKAFLTEMGHTSGPVLPKAANKNAATQNDALTDHVRALVARMGYDADQLVAAYLAKGKRLDQVGKA